MLWDLREYSYFDLRRDGRPYGVVLRMYFLLVFVCSFHFGFASFCPGCGWRGSSLVVFRRLVVLVMLPLVAVLSIYPFWFHVCVDDGFTYTIQFVYIALFICDVEMCCLQTFEFRKRCLCFLSGKWSD